MAIKNKNSVITATFLVSGMTLVGKLLGFIRQAVIADYFGASWQSDAFFFAEKMPKLIFPSIASAFATAFITQYISVSVGQGEKRGDKFASSTLVGMLALSLLICCAGVIVSPWIVRIFAPGFTGEQLDLTIHLSRITIGAYIFPVAQYMLAAILNSKKIFLRSQIGGLFYNLFVVVYTIILGRNQGIDDLTWTIVYGQILQVIILAVFVSKNFHFSLDLKGILGTNRLVLAAALPILLSYCLDSVNQLIDQLLGSLLNEGVVSALSYSASLNNIVTGVFIVALSTVLYPTLAENIANKDNNLFCSNLLKNLTMLFMILVPISAIVFMCSGDIVNIVYARGNFDQNAVNITGMALMYYAWMYPFLAIQNVIVRGFYAMNDSKTPLYLSIMALLINAMLSYWLSKSMMIGGLALGTTISTIFTAISLLIALKKKMPNLRLNALIPTMSKIVLSNICLMLLEYQLLQLLSGFTPLVRFFTAAFLGMVFYLGILFLLKCDELKILVRLLPQKRIKERK